MKWTALNSVGALFWLDGLYVALGASHAGMWASWLPANSLPLGGAGGLIGLVMLLWANLSDA